MDLAYRCRGIYESAPGPSDAKGEGAERGDCKACGGRGGDAQDPCCDCDGTGDKIYGDYSRAMSELLALREGAKLVDAELPEVYKLIGVKPKNLLPGLYQHVKEAIESLKSRASLTPLTDPSVRGVLVACADDDQHLSIVVDDVTGRKCVGKLRPASEFGVPVRVHRKLEAIAESMGVKDWQAAGTSTLASLIAERVRELEAEVENLKALRQDDLIDYVSLLQEAERLRNAIEHLAGECDRMADSLQNPETTKRICAAFAKTVADDLRAALTPPTAASGEGDDMKIGKCFKCGGKLLNGHKCPPQFRPTSAPAAESEGGDDALDPEVAGALKLMENTLLFFDENDQPQFIKVEPIVASNHRRLLQTAFNRGKENRALSARLAACEERCRELERLEIACRSLVASKHRRNDCPDWVHVWPMHIDAIESLLAPKAEGGGDGD